MVARAIFVISLLVCVSNGFIFKTPVNININKKRNIFKKENLSSRSQNVAKTLTVRALVGQSVWRENCCSSVLSPDPTPCPASVWRETTSSAISTVSSLSLTIATISHFYCPTDALNPDRRPENCKYRECANCLSSYDCWTGYVSNYFSSNPTWSTLIGRGMSRLGSYWSRVLLAPAILCHKEPAIARTWSSTSRWTTLNQSQCLDLQISIVFLSGLHRLQLSTKHQI